MLILSQILLLLSVVFLVYVVHGAYRRYREKFTETTKVSLEDMFLFVDPASVFQFNVALFFLVPIVVFFATGSIPLVLISALAMLVFPRAFYKIMRKRRIKKFVEQMPDALAMLSGSMRAGASLQIAMDLVVNESPAPLSQEFSLILREQRLGLSLEDSLDGMAKRLNVEDVDLFVSAMTIAKEVGGNLAEILDRLASTLRTKATMEGKIEALTSQGKMQGIVVGLLPIFLGIVLYAMEPESMEPMFTTYYGWGVMAAIFVMLFLGGFFIKKIVTIDV